jgi:hypothetical protein
MSISKNIISHEMKLMDMGVREEILLEREIVNLIILPRSVTTSLINPSMKRTIIYRQWVIFIFAQISIVYRRLRGDERSKENCMASWRIR